MLNRSYRIPKQNIPTIIKRGKRFTSESFDIKVWYDDSLEHPLFAIVVSTKIDKRAVVRNTIKRKFRAAIYEIRNEELGVGMREVFRKGNYVFLIKNSQLKDLKSREIADLIKKALVSP